MIHTASKNDCLNFYVTLNKRSNDLDNLLDDSSRYDNWNFTQMFQPTRLETFAPNDPNPASVPM